MNIAVVGCGYVAEFYIKTLGNYPNLKLVGAFDTNPSNLSSFSSHWHVRAFDTLEQLLQCKDVVLVLNLTNPRSHYEITKTCLEAGKHVYSEKPLAMDFESAKELAEIARRKSLYLSSAPCSLLCETAQTLWKALRENTIGKVRLIYANFDDGMIAPNLSPWAWRNETGVAWPAKDEFEVGCTYEHAGYLLTWLAAFFGPARKVTSFAACLIPDKGIAVDSMAPDFTVGCIEYDGGIVARLTCSVVAPKDKSLTIIGDAGVLTVANVRNDVCPVYLRKLPATPSQAAIERRVNRLRKWVRANGNRDWQRRRKLPLTRKPPAIFVSESKPVDFCRGIAEMAAAIKEKRPCRLSPELGVHITELIEALQYPERENGSREIGSDFPAIEPLGLMD